MDEVLKIVQIGFYIAGSTVAILTYIKAKNGLLNSVNTEYQKRVMDRLSTLSEELYDEFDNQSENFWGKEDSVKEVLDRIHEYMKTRGGIDAVPGTPIPKKFSKLHSYSSRIKSDPFIPENIRKKVQDLVDTRMSVMISAYRIEMEKYKAGLKEGKYLNSLETNHHWLHNKIIDHLIKGGCGITELEAKVHDIRNAIQTYFEDFNPIKNNHSNNKNWLIKKVRKKCHLPTI